MSIKKHFSTKESGPVKIWDKDMKNALKVFKIESDDPDFVHVVKSVCRIKVIFSVFLIFLFYLIHHKLFYFSFKLDLE